MGFPIDRKKIIFGCDFRFLIMVCVLCMCVCCVCVCVYVCVYVHVCDVIIDHKNFKKSSTAAVGNHNNVIKSRMVTCIKLFYVCLLLLLSQ